MSKITNDDLTQSSTQAQDALQLYPYGYSGRHQRVNVR